MWILFFMACQTSINPEKAKEPLVLQIPENQVEPVEVKKEVSLIEQGAQVFFFRKDCTNDCVAAVKRSVDKWTPEVALRLLYEGPIDEESEYQLLKCNSTGAVIKDISEAPHGYLAEVHLLGDCGGCGTQSIADLIRPTLLQFDEINIVHLYDPQGRTQIERPFLDSNPACLEP